MGSSGPMIASSVRIMEELRRSHDYQEKSMVLETVFESMDRVMLAEAFKALLRAGCRPLGLSGAMERYMCIGQQPTAEMLKLLESNIQLVCGTRRKSVYGRRLKDSVRVVKRRRRK